MTKSRIIFGLFLLLTCATAYAQINFQPGFIVTNQLDTVAGQINFQELQALQTKCVFRNKSLGKKEYQPGEILAFGFETGQVFESQNVDGEMCFVEKLVSGKLNLYYFLGSKARYFVSKNHPPLTELPIRKKFVAYDENDFSKKGKLYLVQQKVDNKNLDQLVYGGYEDDLEEFKKVLKAQMEDAPELFNEIDTIQEPKHKALIQLTMNYNQNLGIAHNFDVKPSIKIYREIEFNVGWSNLNYDYLSSEDRFLVYSLMCYLPFADNYMSIGFGAQYARQTEKLRWNFELYKVPLYLRFQYPGQFIKPNVALGIKLYHIKTERDIPNNSGFIWDIIPSLRAGISIKLVNNFSLSLSAEQEFNWNMYNNNSSNAAFSNTFYGGFVWSF